MDQKTSSEIVCRFIVPGNAPDKVIETYSEWAQHYDEILDSLNYIGPKLAANEVAARIPQEKRGTLKVIDIAAGTGRVGRLLRDKEFSNIDALEPRTQSSWELDKIQSLTVRVDEKDRGKIDKYQDLKIEIRKIWDMPVEVVPIIIGTLGTSPRSLRRNLEKLDAKVAPGLMQNNMYDVLVMAGGFAEGHIPVSGIDDMIRITKPGGLVIITMRKSFLLCEEYKDRLIPYMDEMERQGKWIKEDVEFFDEYVVNEKGILFTYKVI
ncbi:uncharacterized protein LOC135218743 [Macrobrachium nipponense]|uniref:uncharacterized protein LOC135218743 n=1 Tax=Macrobrachium nipponense TaxID=159736 RepID=UPI0030C82CC0